MPRPQGVQTENVVDAALLAAASSGATLERSYVLADMPRLGEAGAGEGSALKVRFRFRRIEERVAIDGVLDGVARLTCQRCMKAVDLPLHDEFNVVVVQDESALSEEIAGYEPILGDATRLDLRALAEDQALLALPLVPRHELDEASAECKGLTQATPDAGAKGKQMPFENLRDLMRRH